MSEDNNHPDKTYRMPRGISTAIWSKEVEEHGTTRTKHSVKLQKSTRDESTGKWKNQDILLFPSEIPAAITVLRNAYEHCCLREQFDEPAPT